MYPVARVVARTELRRVFRSVAASRTKILLYGMLGLFAFVPLLVLGSLLLVAGGEQLATGALDSGDLDPVPGVVTGAIAVGLIGLVLMATVRSFTTVADVDEPACLLVSTPVSNVVAGLLLAEGALVCLWLGPPTMVLAGAFAYGAGTPLPVLVAPAVLAVLVAVAVPIGFAAGVVVRHLLTVYEPVARYRTPLLVAIGVGYFGAIVLGWIDRITALLFQALGDSPLGWPGHLLLAGVPGVPFSPVLVLAAVGAAVLLVPVATAAGVRVATLHWFADPVEAPEEDKTERDSTDRLGTALSGLLSRPVETVTVTAIRRTKRAPVQILYVAYPLFGAVPLVQQAVQTGTLPAYGAVVLSLYVVWGTGALFTLNLLGDHGPAMESVLLSTVSGREMVTGSVLAGILVGVPVAIVVSTVSGLVSPLSVEATALLAVGTVAGTAVSAGLATGVGSLFPRFGSVRVTNNREAVMPSKTAFIVYTLGIAAPAVAAVILYVDSLADLVATLLSGLFSLLPVLDVSVSATTVTLLAWVVLVLGVAGPIVSLRYAIRRFDTYRPY